MPLQKQNSFRVKCIKYQQNGDLQQADILLCGNHLAGRCFKVVIKECILVAICALAIHHGSSKAFRPIQAWSLIARILCALDAVCAVPA